ncbi:hypothetical protein [Arthrobacter sp. NEB 688]|uniref:hypothetical protein n=1 Tax=Arthrobacter sp. NEB 688 TaxID=904039 RepID=UPI001564E188|nr:hypothetical protein [Arthrobacter sp. NEB 688]QKE85353.1 hypothetical protein HL663_16340 [Arthrobacter sp. NEB 688]
MTPARRWRRTATLLVVLADVLLLGLASLSTPVTALVLTLPLAGLTWWGLRRPGRWGATLLVVAQVVVVGTSGAAPADIGGWAAAVLAAALVLATHLCLALLAAFPPGAGLPRATLRRWASQGGLLATAGAAAAVVGLLGSRTPSAWGTVVVTLALAGLAATAALAWRTARSG